MGRYVGVIELGGHLPVAVFNRENLTPVGIVESDPRFLSDLANTFSRAFERSYCFRELTTKEVRAHDDYQESRRKIKIH